MMMMIINMIMIMMMMIMIKGLLRTFVCTVFSLSNEVWALEVIALQKGLSYWPEVSTSV